MIVWTHTCKTYIDTQKFSVYIYIYMHSNTYTSTCKQTLIYTKYTLAHAHTHTYKHKYEHMRKPILALYIDMQTYICLPTCKWVELPMV